MKGQIVKKCWMNYWRTKGFFASMGKVFNNHFTQKFCQCDQIHCQQFLHTTAFWSSKHYGQFFKPLCWSKVSLLLSSQVMLLFYTLFLWSCFNNRNRHTYWVEYIKRVSKRVQQEEETILRPRKWFHFVIRKCEAKGGKCSMDREQDMSLTF